MEAAGIEPASAVVPDRASTSVGCAWNLARTAGAQPTYRRASHPWVSRFGRLALPPRQPVCCHRLRATGPARGDASPNWVRRRVRVRDPHLRLVPGVLRGLRDLGLQLCRRIDHVETRSPPYVCCAADFSSGRRLFLAVRDAVRRGSRSCAVKTDGRCGWKSRASSSGAACHCTCRTSPRRARSEARPSGCSATLSGRRSRDRWNRRDESG